MEKESRLKRVSAITRLEHAIDRMQSTARINRELRNPPRLSDVWLRSVGIDPKTRS